MVSEMNESFDNVKHLAFRNRLNRVVFPLIVLPPLTRYILLVNSCLGLRSGFLFFSSALEEEGHHGH